jgi:hypothetical protein
MVLSQPRQTVRETLSQKNPWQKTPGEVAQGVGPEFKPQHHIHTHTKYFILLEQLLSYLLNSHLYFPHGTLVLPRFPPPLAPGGNSLCQASL